MSDRRNHRIQSYVDEDVDEKIEQLAERKDVTTSEYVADVLRAHVEDTVYERKSREMAAERRLQALIAEGRDQMLDAMDGSDEAITKSALYSIATWELIKGAFGPEERKQAIQRATNRLTEDLTKMGVDPDVITDGMADDPVTDDDEEYSQGWDFS
jgi:hypothetical protein